MVVGDTVDLVADVNGERHAIQTLVTHTAAETPGVVGLAHGLQDLHTHTRHWLDSVRHNTEDGWTCPCPVESRKEI